MASCRADYDRHFVCIFRLSSRQRNGKFRSKKHPYGGLHMKAIDRPLPHILNGASQFVIPVFQRDYTWQAETQCAQLWRDIVRASRTQGEQGHFLGSIVYIATGDNSAGFTQWLLIDGQQRLTTITLLM